MNFIRVTGSVNFNKGPSFILLDGGTATELEARGKQLDSALWSAQVIETDREALKCVHKVRSKSGT